MAAGSPVESRRFANFAEIAGFLWQIADLLRGDYKQADYGKVILPFTVLRRLDCVLEPTKQKVIDRHAKLKGGDLKSLDVVLNRVAGVPFHNVSPLDFRRLLADPNNIAHNLTAYVKGFSEDVREIFLQRFKLPEQIAKLDESNLLFQVVQRFAAVDLHPAAVPNHQMGLVFEELIRRFAEQSNETAGEHFTPREVIRLMVNLLFIEDAEVLTRPGIVKTLFDPACGTGGMLSVAEEYLHELNPEAHLEVFGAEPGAADDAGDPRPPSVAITLSRPRSITVPPVAPANWLSKVLSQNTRPFSVPTKLLRSLSRKVLRLPRLTRSLSSTPAPGPM